MLIKSVELKNIKSYSHETIEFMDGINGICGQNGHGKTTILEAIGYALFDCPPYKKIADFLRHGEKSGYVAVTVEGNDEIEYTIYRKVGGTDYYIRTPVGEIKGKKDVTDWIASNLLYNVRSPQDMPSIFENAVGVPQGTFTTSFLLNPEPRKKVFDDILRVEEYKAAYTNLRETITAIEKTIDSLDRDLIPLRTRTERYPELKKDKESLKAEIDGLKKEIKEINTRSSSLTKKKEELTGKKAQLDALSAQIANERIRLVERGSQLEKAKLDLSSAGAARKLVDELLPAEENYKKGNLALKELNGDRVKRDKLREALAELDFKICRLQEKLDHSLQLFAENKELGEKKKLLAPKIEAARRLEDSIRELQKELRDPLNDIISRLLNLWEKLKRMEDINREIKEQKARISALLPLKRRQSELEFKIKDMKDNLEAPLRTLLSEISVLKEKEAQSKKLQSEILHLISKKNKLMPAVKRHEALGSEIRAISVLLDSLTRLGFELKQAIEREQRADALASEIEKLNTSMTALAPLIEQQIAHQARQHELDQQYATVQSLLKKTRSNMKLAGTQGLCPVLNGIKCSSVSDFTQYFKNELGSLNKELEEIESQLSLVSEELKRIGNPVKQREDMVVLTEAKNKELGAYRDIHNEVNSCREKLRALASSYSLSGVKILTGNEDEQKAISQRLQSDKKEYEELQKSVVEFEGTDALITSKNRDLADLSNIPALLAECCRKIELLNSRFSLDIEIDSIKKYLESTALEISSLEKSLKEMNDPVGQIAMVESLIASRQADVDSLRDVPAAISACLEQLEGLNSRFHLKDKLGGSPEELKLVDELIENKNRELKVLNSPDKELEKLNEVIEKNQKELKTLEHVPGELDSCRRKKDELISSSLVFEGLDEKIASLQDTVTKLEPEHNKYLLALPAAQKIDEYARECRKLEESVALINSALNEYTCKQEELSSEFDESLLKDAISQLEELGRASSAKTEAVKGKNRDMEKLTRELAGMESELEKIKEIEKKLENEKQFLSFSNFVRDTIKNSSEYIVNEFIGEISQEASNIYSEIMDDYSCGLKWANDYDIEIEAAGEVKSFRQLSGGERMGAALSVRLALLKALSNCDFVFLDEPTQNMDELRREKLSQEIMKIRGFKQVFVISHDDTFNEKYGHVVKIQKIDDESRVMPCLT